MLRPLRTLLATACCLAGLLPGTAHAVGVGLSDGRVAMFDSPQLRDVNFPYVRLVLPWDAATRSGSWDAWLDRAAADGYPVLLAPTASGSAPSPTAYEAALRQLLDRYPNVDAVEGWNEPNHASQPTAGRPSLAAAYFEAARRACASRCTTVAGNLLDAPSMPTYLAAYRAALATEPAVWGVHDYYDSTYFQRDGVDAMLALTRSGPIWLTETGGMVSFAPNGPGTGLPPDEHRAADSLRWLFSLAAAEPRIARMYLYGLWQQPSNAFDSALLRVDNTERESMAVVRQQVPRRAAAASGATPSGGGTAASGGPASTGTPSATLTPLLRLVGKRIAVARTDRRAAITMRCAITDCRGRLTARVGRWTYARDVRLKAGTTKTIRVRLTRRAARALSTKATSTARARLCRAGSCSSVPIVAG